MLLLVRVLVYLEGFLEEHNMINGFRKIGLFISDYNGGLWVSCNCLSESYQSKAYLLEIQ